jgi:hypothetical protein
MTEQERFEAMFPELTKDKRHGRPDQYKDLTANLLWEGWQAAIENQWQPIETAPKDFVTRFDGWNGERVTDLCWDYPNGAPKGHFAWCVEEHEQHYGWKRVEVKGLTHWMPLPQPPKK